MPAFSMSRVLQINVVALQVVPISVGDSMQHTRDMNRILNAYASPEGVAELVAVYRKVLGEIRRTVKRAPGMSTERDLQFAVIELLQECNRYQIPPPSELAALVGDLFKTGDEARRRSRVRFPIAKVKKIKAETGLKGRKLAHESRLRGLKVSDRSLARHEKDFEPQ
jgi:hypothetical protein